MTEPVALKSVPSCSMVNGRYICLSALLLIRDVVNLFHGTMFNGKRLFVPNRSRSLAARMQETIDEDYDGAMTTSLNIGPAG
jgi:hypothetical protein